MKTTVLVVSLLVPVLASAQELGVTRAVPIEGKNEISTQVGFQASLGGSTPSGVKLLFDYSRKLTDLVWFNVKLNPTFAVDSRTICYDRFGNAYDCGYGLSGDGHSIDALAGVKLKFHPRTRVTLVPYLNLDAGVVGIYARPLNDNGAAIVFRPGAGLRWFITPHVAIGGEANFALGGGFYSETCRGCQNGHTEFYRAFDLAIGAEFTL